LSSAPSTGRGVCLQTFPEAVSFREGHPPLRGLTDGPGSGPVFRVRSRGSWTADTSIGEIRPVAPKTKLIFLVPPLAPGDYTLEVRARAGDNEDVHTGRLPYTLTVAEVPMLELPPARVPWPAAVEMGELSG
jgi:hypothetical protein